MMRRVWVPREIDDEQRRQLDLFIWGDALAGAKERAKRVFMQMIRNGAFEVPSVTDLAATGTPLMQAVRQHESAIAKMHASKKWILEDEPYRHAAEAALRGTTLSWDQTRQLIWERDGGVCQVCGDAIEWREYECGHIIDRCVGGSDRLSNLVCMCIVCNRLKPLTKTRAEYLAWARQGGPAMEVAAIVLELFKVRLGKGRITGAIAETINTTTYGNKDNPSTH
jgi:5-methylcytosine-specific restriction endonuclease McrA